VDGNSGWFVERQEIGTFKEHIELPKRQFRTSSTGARRLERNKDLYAIAGVNRIFCFSAPAIQPHAVFAEQLAHVTDGKIPGQNALESPAALPGCYDDLSHHSSSYRHVCDRVKTRSGNICNSVAIKIAYPNMRKRAPIAGARARRGSSLNRIESVDALRKKIDQVDEKIIKLLNDRAFLAQRIGHHKRLTNQEVYVPGREQEVVQRVAELSRGPLPLEAVQSVYREIIAACRGVEAPLRVAFFGAEASYSHLVARERFGSTATLLPTASIAEVFQDVSRGRVLFGVVPIENSTEGVVAYTLDLLVDSRLQICAESFLDIHHSLLSRSGRAEEVSRIVSHPQALAQCRGWLSRHFSKVELEEVPSTSHAAVRAAQNDTVAAISSSLAAELYDLKIIATNIEDQSHNITRFFVIGDKPGKPSRRDKTSLAFSVKDEPGILHRMLRPFASRKINLSKIESRPIKNKPWEYMFFLDLKGHQEEPRVKSAIAQVERHCTFFKILGSYPSGA